jgi:hypothetical protein
MILLLFSIKRKFMVWNLCTILLILVLISILYRNQNVRRILFILKVILRQKSPFFHIFTVGLIY